MPSGHRFGIAQKRLIHSGKFSHSGKPGVSWAAIGGGRGVGMVTVQPIDLLR